MDRAGFDHEPEMFRDAFRRFVTDFRYNAIISEELMYAGHAGVLL